MTLIAPLVVTGEAATWADHPGGSVPTAKNYSYLEPGPLAKSVALWLQIYLAAAAAYGLVAVYSFFSLAGLDPTSDISQGVPSDLAVGLVALIYFACYAVAGFLVLKWTYRVNRNAQTFAKGLPNSPPWSVGWYFIPFAALWKPFEALADSWKASQQPESWRTTPLPRFFRWWWGLWLVTSILGNGSWRLPQETVSERLLVTALDIVSASLEVPLALVLIRIVRELSSAQEVQHAFGDGRVAEPPALVLGSGAGA